MGHAHLARTGDPGAVDTRRAEGGDAGSGANGPTRLVGHGDLDCFFAAVEMRRRGLVNVPVAVGWRNVVSSASYEARQYGVRSAMRVSDARRLCPQLVVVEPEIDRYREVSLDVMAAICDEVDVLERVSIDEAFFSPPDSVSGSGDSTAARRWADGIRDAVTGRTGLVISVGIGPNKLCAKLASRRAKPAGVYVVDVPAAVLVAEHALGELPGIGPSTRTRLTTLGIHDVVSLAGSDPEALRAAFGAHQAQRLVQLARGEDHDPVSWTPSAVSCSRERPIDPTTDPATIGETAGQLGGELDRRAQRAIVRVTTTLWDPTPRSRSVRITGPIGALAAASAKAMVGERPVRRVGVGVTYAPVDHAQLPLFDALWHAGDTATHPTFGEGVCVLVDDPWAVVRFADRTRVLELARLQRR